MAITLEQIEDYLNRQNLRFERLKDRPEIATGFRMHRYKDFQDRPSIFVVIRLEEEGEFLKVFAPGVYRLKDSPNAGAVMMALLGVSWRTKMLQFEYDENDGEVRAIIEFPVEDGTVTERQFMRALHGIASIIDNADPIIRRAIESGTVHFDDAPGSELSRLMETIARIGGPAPARAALEEKLSQQNLGPEGI